MSGVIEIENLGKKYLLNHPREPYMALRDVLAERVGGISSAISRLFTSRTSDVTTANREEFWALKGVTCEIQQGERVGIIGRNGAGKSTLLKILSRIVEPTEGRVRIAGRVASLLEVGTGFHPELTGRENIFLNGAILGMSKVEVRKKFDEIVAFAEVERFLDTPVKRYSSGMHVRLAFAVAAHLEPEILLVDEVLAVGDAQFQKKCLGKMEEVSTREGRTLLFVSHNMTAIESLCSKAFFISDGRIVFTGSPVDVISKYFEQSGNANGTNLKNRSDRSGTGKIRITGISVVDISGSEVNNIFSGNDYEFKFSYEKYCNYPLDDVVVSIDIFDESMARVLMFRSNFTKHNIRLESTAGYVSCIIPNIPLAKGSYSINIFVSHKDVEILDYVEGVMTISVVGGDFFGTGSEGMPSHCKVLHSASWHTEVSG